MPTYQQGITSQKTWIFIKHSIIFKNWNIKRWLHLLSWESACEIPIEILKVHWEQAQKTHCKWRWRKSHRRQWYFRGEGRGGCEGGVWKGMAGRLWMWGAKEWWWSAEIVVRGIKKKLAPISNLKMFTIQRKKLWYVVLKKASTNL